MTEEELKFEVQRVLTRVPSSVLPDVLEYLKGARLKAQDADAQFSALKTLLKQKAQPQQKEEPENWFEDLFG